jgi:hypothetical protein
MAPPATARAKLEEYGIDQFCEDVCDGKTITSIAQSVGVSYNSLMGWIASDPERSARAWQARKFMAWYWADEGQRLLREAGDDVDVFHPDAVDLMKFRLAKAHAQAQWMKWRAAIADPKGHGGNADWPDDPGSQPDVAGQIAEGADPVEASRVYADIVGGK